MIKIFKNLRLNEVLLMILATVFIVVQVWLDLKLPDYMSDITMLVQSGDSAMSEIWQAGGKMLLCALGSMVSSVIVAVAAAKISSSFGANIREKLYLRVQSFSMEEINRFSTASLITRSTNDITQVQTMIVMGMQVIVKAPITAVWAITKIYDKGFEWTAATGIAVVILLLGIGTVLLIARPKFKMMQKLTDNLNRVTRENLTGLSVVRAYNAEKYQTEKFEQANGELTAASLFSIRAMSVMFPFIGIVMNGLSVAIYIIGAYLINGVALDMSSQAAAQAFFMERADLFSNMVVFSAYAMQVVMSFMMLVVIFVLLPRASVAAVRINEVLETKPNIEDGNQTEGVSGMQGEVEFRNVSFRYPDSSGNMLENISFCAHRGETVAIIGSTGCGKTTAINLIPRFYDVTEGEVLVDGRNVKEYTQEALHNKLGYVSQKAFMFKGTIASNIGFGSNGKSDATEADIARAIEIASGTDFVSGKEDGIHSEVAQNGTNFSGGQRQRLSIARAVARDAEILIFDDSFSALDYKTDRKVRHLLREHCKDATKLIIAQRIGTIRDADRIVVLDDGKVAGIGTHSELMESCEVYQQIALSQLSKEELA